MKKNNFTNYEKLFTRLYNEMINAKNEIEVIYNEMPADEECSHYDHLFKDENEKEKYLTFPSELPDVITPKLIEMNCDREYVMWCMELNMALKRYDSLIKMIYEIAMSNDEAFEAKTKLYKKMTK